MTRTETRTAAAPSRTARPLVALSIGAAVVVALFLIDAWAPALFPAPLPTRAQDGLTLAISVLIESLPFVILGVVLSIVVQVWVPPGVIERWMPRRAWARRAVLSLLGMVVPVCECGNVPFAR
ncbi:MAG: permease, partial [Microbacterium sp.]